MYGETRVLYWKILLYDKVNNSLSRDLTPIDSLIYLYLFQSSNPVFLKKLVVLFYFSVTMPTHWVRNILIFRSLHFQLHESRRCGLKGETLAYVYLLKSVTGRPDPKEVRPVRVVSLPRTTVSGDPTRLRLGPNPRTG